MAITSTDIQNQGFSISKNGYRVEEVDEFLEFVSDEIDALNSRVAELEQQLSEGDNDLSGFDTPARAMAETQIISPVANTSAANDAALAEKDARIAALQAQLDEAKADGNAIAQVLIVAQRNADEIVEKAQAQAGDIVNEAHSQADEIISEANAEREEVEQTIDSLESEREEVRSGYQEMLKNLIADATSKLSDLNTDDAVATSAHARPRTSSARSYTSARTSKKNTQSAVNTREQASSEASVKPANEASTPAYNLFTSKPTVAAATPSPSAIEKDFSGFGDTDDDFAVDDID